MYTCTTGVINLSLGTAYLTNFGINIFRHSNSPDFTGSLPESLLVSRFLSNSPDFSEYSGNIVKNHKYTVFSTIIVCFDLFMKLLYGNL